MKTRQTPFKSSKQQLKTRQTHLKSFKQQFIRLFQLRVRVMVMVRVRVTLLLFMREPLHSIVFRLSWGCRMETRNFRDGERKYEKGNTLFIVIVHCQVLPLNE